MITERIQKHENRKRELFDKIRGDREGDIKEYRQTVSELTELMAGCPGCGRVLGLFKDEGICPACTQELDGLGKDSREVLGLAAAKALGIDDRIKEESR